MCIFTLESFGKHIMDGLDATRAYINIYTYLKNICIMESVRLPFKYIILFFFFCQIFLQQMSSIC